MKAGPPLICPICNQRLTSDESSVRCVNRHTFNRAREGYIDLVVPGRGRSGVRGDTRDMVRARRRIMERGHFDGVTGAVADIATRYLVGVPDGVDVAAVLDVGCGEGRYLGAVVSAVRSRGTPIHAFGFDVSRDALRVAARTVREACFFVWDVADRIPIASGTMSVLINAFAPRNPAEFARVLRPGGALLVVIPAPDHLAELRAVTHLLRIDADKADRVLRRIGPDFDLVAQRRVEYTIAADGADLLDLVRMSPSRWHVDVDRLERETPQEGLALTIVADVLELRRR